MAKKVLILENGAFAIQRVNDATGTTSDMETYESEKAFDVSRIARILRDTVHGYGALRVACLSALGGIFEDTTLATWAGVGDAKKGVLTKEFKAAMRDAETAYFRGLVQSGELPARLKNDQSFQEWISALRDEKNYQGCKAIAGKYFFLAGKSCVTESGYVVPVQVMQAELSELKDKEKPDTSIAARIIELQHEVNNRKEGTALISEKWGYASAIAALRDIMATFEGLQREAVELANHRKAIPTEHRDVVKLATQASNKAQRTAKAQKVKGLENLAAAMAREETAPM